MNDISEISIHLSAGSEMFVAVPRSEKRCSSSIKVASVGGGVEPRVDVLGAPVLVDVSYNLIPGMIFSVFAWSNATIHIEGSKQLVLNCFRSTAPSVIRPMVEYHCIIHDARTLADKRGLFGPVVAICGRNEIEKHSIARSMCSYAARTGWCAQLVDLDCGVGQLFGPPGTLSASIVEYPLTLDENLSTGPISVCYFTGTTEPQVRNSHGEWTMFSPYVHYSHLIMTTVVERIAKHVGGSIGASGAVLVLPDLRGVNGVIFLEDFAKRFNISHVLCVGDDHLFSALHTKLVANQDAHENRSSSIRVDKITESFLSLPTDIRAESLSSKFERYFLGGGAVDLQPTEITKSFGNITIFMLKDVDGQTVLSNIQHDALEGIVGCVGALFESTSTRESDVLSLAPFALARVQGVNTNGVSLLISTHSAISSEKLLLIIGTLHWLTS